MLPFLQRDPSADIIVGTFVAAFLCILLCYLRTRMNKHVILNRHRNSILMHCMGKQEWDFSNSWATSITTLGAFLGTVISAQVSVEKNHVGLNLLFGLLALFAPILYRATAQYITTDDHPEGKPALTEPQGYIWGFFLTSLITLWAVFGELLTIVIMLNDLNPNSSTNASATVLVQSIQIFLWVFLIIALLSVIIYTLRTIPWTVEEQITTAASKKREKPGVERPSLKPWNLL